MAGNPPIGHVRRGRGTRFDCRGTQLRGHAYWPMICDCGAEGRVRGSKLVDGSLLRLLAGRSRAPGGGHDGAAIRIAQRAKRRRLPRSLPGATAGRHAEPVLPFHPRVPPAARWAAAMRPRAGLRPSARRPHTPRVYTTEQDRHELAESDRIAARAETLLPGASAESL